MWFISYYPLKQGLKLDLQTLRDQCQDIYILLSIKTRIETSKYENGILYVTWIYILLSIKTRIETFHFHSRDSLICIYILLSIKTRIETSVNVVKQIRIANIYILLSIKTRIETTADTSTTGTTIIFISYYPLKQGLKPPTVVFSARKPRYLYPTIH